jgi:hypothetical protein
VVSTEGFIQRRVATVEAENPRLQLRLASLQEEEAVVENALRENQLQITTRIRENAVVLTQYDNFIVRARTKGKIAQYLQSAGDRGASMMIDAALDEARSKVSALEAELDDEASTDKLETFLNIISGFMTRYADQLDLEEWDGPLRLDLRNVTVVADALEGPIPLYRMGSGENWVGYHVLAHLALHKWFRQKNRPVPGFLIFDQPSQAHYPPERDRDGSINELDNEDQAAVLKLFKLISDAAIELAPELQIIVLDHADLKQGWFEAAVVERWRHGAALIPSNWINGV